MVIRKDVRHNMCRRLIVAGSGTVTDFEVILRRTQPGFDHKQVHMQKNVQTKSG